MKKILISLMIFGSTTTFATEVCLIEQGSQGALISCDGESWKREGITASGVQKNKLEKGFKIQSTNLASNSYGAASVLYTLVKP